MEDIDNLSGQELKIAVAEALGYTRSEYIAGGHWFLMPDGSGLIRINDIPDWPTSLDAAWELDIEGARWESEEHYKIVKSPVVWVRCFAPDNGYTGEAQFSDFPTKAAAYATARCRAWLKAQQAAGVTTGA